MISLKGTCLVEVDYFIPGNTAHSLRQTSGEMGKKEESKHLFAIIKASSEWEIKCVFLKTLKRKMPYS